MRFVRFRRFMQFVREVHSAPRTATDSPETVPVSGRTTRDHMDIPIPGIVG